MLITVVGVHQGSAALATREKVAWGIEQQRLLAGQLQRWVRAKEVLVVATCQRTEIYTVGVSPAVLRNWLIQQGQFAPEEAQAIYTEVGVGALAHLIRVLVGLESFVLGEAEIVRQVREAFRRAGEWGLLDKYLHRLFQQGLAVAKRIRHETMIGAHSVSLAYTAVSLARRIFADMRGLRVLLIGAGDMIRLTAEHLCAQGIKQLTFMNRTPAHVAYLLARLPGRLGYLEELQTHLAQVDMVISCTASPVFLVTEAMVVEAQRARWYEPLLLIDMAVPRDIQPSAGELAGTYLYNLDDLKGIIRDHQQARRRAASQADIFIEAACSQFADWLQLQTQVNLIRDFRLSCEISRDKLVEQALRQLQAGQAPEGVVQRLAHVLTNQITHQPTQWLRQGVFGPRTQLEWQESY